MKGIFCTRDFTEGIDGLPLSVYTRLVELFPEAQVYCLRQIHSDVIVRAELCTPGEFPVADGILCQDPEPILCIRTADCVPVLLWSKDVPCIGAVHAGWRGLAKGIVGKAIRMMHSLGARDVHVRLGPSIGPCCYEVGQDVVQALGLVMEPFREGTYRVDLAEIARRQAMEQNIPGDMIHGSLRCTCCHPREYFSYRRDGELAGRNISLIGGTSCLLPGLRAE